MSRPIELLRGGNVGEREPKAASHGPLGFDVPGRRILYRHHHKKSGGCADPVFGAVLLVMAGTYLLFTTGSIVILKSCAGKKAFTIRQSNFTSVSGMLYRMKQNAVGLSNICILSTGVLLMLSTTVCLNYGMKDIMNRLYPWDTSFSMNVQSLSEARQVDRFGQCGACRNRGSGGKYHFLYLSGYGLQAEDNGLCFPYAGKRCGR